MKLIAGNALKLCRVRARIKQQDVAKKMTLTPARIVALETSDKPVELELIERYAKIIGVPVEVPILISIKEEDIHEAFRDDFKKMQITAYDYLVNLESKKKSR